MLRRAPETSRRAGLAAFALLLALAARPALAQDGPDPPPQEDAANAKDSATQDPAKSAGSQRPRRPPADPHRPWGEGVRRQTYMGRWIAPVMSYLGADWLLRPEREAEEEPERMLDALGIKPGMVVADVGAGVGFTSVRIAPRVVPGGKVLATDIQPQMIRMLRRNVREMKLDEVITPILCTADDPKLPEGRVDLVIMVDVYHECTHPVETLRGIREALKPDGRLVLVEFRGEDPEVPIKPEHKMTVAQVRKEVEPQGFVLAERHDFLPWQHVLVFKRSEAEAEAGGSDRAAPADVERDQEHGGGHARPDRR